MMENGSLYVAHCSGEDWRMSLVGVWASLNYLINTKKQMEVNVETLTKLHVCIDNFKKTNNNELNYASFHQMITSVAFVFFVHFVVSL